MKTVKYYIKLTGSSFFIAKTLIHSSWNIDEKSEYVQLNSVHRETAAITSDDFSLASTIADVTSLRYLVKLREPESLINCSNCPALNVRYNKKMYITVR